jgi:uncharacterized protein YjcR
MCGLKIHIIQAQNNHTQKIMKIMNEIQKQYTEVFLEAEKDLKSKNFDSLLENREKLLDLMNRMTQEELLGVSAIIPRSTEF